MVTIPPLLQLLNGDQRDTSGLRHVGIEWPTIILGQSHLHAGKTEVMPTLDWMGIKAVVNHHQQIPFVPPVTSQVVLAQFSHEGQVRRASSGIGTARSHIKG